jgi:hypothetical protein
MLFCRHSFNPLNTFMRKGKDPHQSDKNTSRKLNTRTAATNFVLAGRNDRPRTRQAGGGGEHKLLPQFARTDTRKFSFPVRAVEQLNRRPDEMKQPTKRSSKQGGKAVLRIRIRIRIQRFWSIRIRIQIQGFDDQKLEKIYDWKKNILNLLIPRPPERTSKLQQKSSLLKREHLAFQNLNFLHFCG